MKDSEFTELLNLYLDHEITAADAARLEAEVQSNANRRRVYQDYCRMQKACKILAQDFADEPASATDRKVVAFEAAGRTGQRRPIPFYLAGTLAAAAACAVVVFVSRSHVQPLSAEGSTVATTTAISATQAAVPAATLVAKNGPTAPAHNGIERQSLASLSLRNGAANALALTASIQNDPHFAWLQDVRLTPIQAPIPTDQMQLDVAPSLKPDNRTYTGSKPLPHDIQWTAFRFQR